MSSYAQRARRRRARYPLLLSDSDWEGWAEMRQEDQLIAELNALEPRQAPVVTADSARSLEDLLMEALSKPLEPDAPVSGCLQG